MNQYILNIMKIYCIASVVYLIYSLYLKITNAYKVEDLFKDNTDLLDKYNKIKRNRIMVFIIGIVIGLVILVINEPETISLSTKLTSSITNMKSIVDDVSDISVI